MKRISGGRGAVSSAGPERRSPFTFLPTAVIASWLGGSATLGGCGPAPAPAAAVASKQAAATPNPRPKKPNAAPTLAPKEFDPCDGSPPVPRTYFGILRTARCDQDMFLTMAGVAGQLGVECRYCHVPHPTEPKKEDYPVMTSRKEIANWMSMHLMPALRQADGSPVRCKSCHADAQGRPVAKFLGNPRDPVKAHEWMSLVMVNKFVTASGQKLRCKSCHVGNFSTPQWQPKVILQTAQIPPH